MNKLPTTFLAGVAALGLAVAGAAWASPAAAAAELPVPAVSALVSAQSAAPTTLTPAEIAGLTFMREEEKLARDVYLALDDAWNLQVFANIARSEQNHMDAVGTLLTRYGLPDPAAGNAPGEFTHPDLQALYDQLVAQGGQSLGEALRVGATIEEIDIRDLHEQLPGVRHSDIRRVYEQLEQGSENHLRAFVSTLERQTGETYEPQYLDQAVYDEIVGGTSGQGGRGRGRGRPS
jgi:hypothetical protein